MPLFACGINHMSAPLPIREQIALSFAETKKTLKDLLSLGAVHEALILSTCNRVELYADTADARTFINWLEQQHQISVCSPYWYTYEEQYAISHIMRVASGLDSMVVGEPQILGQLKDAYAIACEAGSIGTRLQKLFQKIFHVTKQVRTDTLIGANSISIGSATVDLAKRIFSDLPKKNVLLIGAGEIIELTAMHFFNNGIKRLVVANRSLANAEELAKKFNAHWINLSDIPIYLKDMDIIVTATASHLPILGKGSVETAIKLRKHRPIFMVDLAVPRDIEPEVSELEDVFLYNIDDLKQIIDENRHSRLTAAEEAEMLINIQAGHVLRELQTLDVSNTIAKYRKKMQKIAEEEITKAKLKLTEGKQPEEIIEYLAQNLLNKFLHHPTLQIKQAAYDGRQDLILFARQLLDL